MDLAGVAAVLALLSIPTSVLLARWQMRTALAQSEANHRTALEVAEVNHRAALGAIDANHEKAMETAEANHQRALELATESHRSAMEVARQQGDTEYRRWMAEIRSAEYRNFENTLAEFRRAFLSHQAGSDHFMDVLAELHRSRYYIGHLGPDDVISIVERIDLVCQTLATHVELSERAEWWSTRIRPLRTELSEAVKRALTGR
ncbi:hypothetical protein AB0M68_19150 [Streptomyces sp. NPDC051453]|uniref:hypothetical protein n=1 Tax=Streptomyces sp. NPDC051453 TaxID=3154941 RepID=UPI003422B790